MTKTFDFDTPIDRMGTYCTQWDYVQDRFGKADLLPFTISDMDFATPPEIIAALEKRIAHPVLGYSRWNHDDYKNAISDWFVKRFDAKVDKNSIVYGPSVIYIVSKLIEEWTSEGEGVVIQTPAYDAFEKMIAGAKRKCVPCKMIKGAQGWEMDWAVFESCLAKPENNVFLLCSPQNPTGKIWTHEELSRMAQLCQQHQVKIISDEIHMDVAFKTHTPFNRAAINDGWALVTSASKSFNIPALNGAYGFIPSESTRDTYLHKLKEVDGLSSPSILAVIATMTAYNEGEGWLDALNAYVRKNHEFVAAELNKAFPSVDYKIPDGTYLAWIDLRSLTLDIARLQRDLIDIHNVAIMDGSVYGKEGQGFVRLNLGCAKSKVEIGVSALIAAIKMQNK